VATNAYQAFFNTLTPEQQFAVISQVHQSAYPTHSIPTVPGIGRLQPTAPMRPTDVRKDWSLDYVSPLSIKLYNKAIEKLPGDPFNGKMLYAWLQRIQDKANTCSWTSILTINGSLLTEKYAEISLEEVRKHAQAYQNEARRYAQNAEQLITCLKGSITKGVHTRVHQLRSKFFPTREPEKEVVQDGICYLKVIIDCYHCNARSATEKVRKQLSRLHMYMREVARGDVSKLCQHTRELLDKLYAAG